MDDKLKKVENFHYAFNIPIEDKPKIPSRERCELRQNILEEEVNELKESWENNDLEGVADALVDINYVLYGTVLEFGMQDKFNQMFEEVHNSNMSKLDDDGNPILREDGKVMKSHNYYSPDLGKFLKDKNK